MTSEEKKSELKKYRDIILATIDYKLGKTAGSMIYDGFGPVADYYLQQKQQTEKYYQNDRIDRLKQKFQSMTETLMRRGDLNFDKYIKEKTDYETDIFENLQLRIEQIIEQKEIKNQNDYSDVIAIQSLHKQIPTEQEKFDILNNLLHNFVDKRSNPASLNVIISNEKPPGIYSSDNRCRIIISESGTDRNCPLTSIAICFEQASGGIYAVKGINLAINAYWKDNNTVVIETKRDYEAIVKCKQVQSFNDIVKIEYIES